MSPPPTATHATAHPTLNAAQQALVNAKKLEATRKKRMSEEKKRKSLVTPSSTQSVNTKSTPPSNLPKPFKLAKALNRTPASPNNNPETLLATTSSPNRLSVLESDPNGSETFATQENAFEHLEDQEHLYGDLDNVDLENLFDSISELRASRAARGKKKQAPKPETPAAKAAEATADGDKKPAAVENPRDAVRPLEDSDPVAPVPPSDTTAAALAAAVAELRMTGDEMNVDSASADDAFSPQPTGERLQQLRKQYVTKFKFSDFQPSLDTATSSLPKPIKDEVSRAAKALFDATAKVTASELVLERYALQPELIPSGARIKFGITTAYKNISADEPTLIQIREELSGCITDFHVNARRLVLAKVKFEKDFFTKHKTVELLTCLHTLANQELTTWLLRNSSSLQHPDTEITNDKRKIVGQIIYRLIDDPTLLSATVFTYLGMDRLQCKAVLQAGWYRPPKLRVAYELASARSSLTTKDLECINKICESMQLYVEPMTAGIQKLFNDAVQEKILDAHLRAQTKQLNIQNAAKATQAALDNTQTKSETDMEAFIQRAISAGIEQAVKNLTLPTSKNSKGHAKAPAVEPKGKGNKRPKGNDKKEKPEKQSQEPANKRQRTKNQKDDNNAPEIQEKSNKNRQRPKNKRRNGGKKGNDRQGAAKSDEE
jgi:hypothetical protein